MAMSLKYTLQGEIYSNNRVMVDIKFKLNEILVARDAIDATRFPLLDETLVAWKQSDAFILAAIAGYKWTIMSAI
jgi:isocitrate/isopropylmalate dehydrogenase